jgi:hypothetical protein
LILYKVCKKMKAFLLFSLAMGKNPAAHPNRPAGQPLLFLWRSQVRLPPWPSCLSRFFSNRPDLICHRARYRPGTVFISKPIYLLLDFLLSFAI